MNAKEKLVQARMAILYKKPEEMTKVLARRDMNQPLGCMYYATSSARQFSDLLYDIRTDLAEGKLSFESAKQILPPFLAHLENELGGMYGLDDSEVVVHGVTIEVPSCTKESLLELLDELVSYLKRLYFWLDLYVPWDTMNEQLRLGLVP